MNETEEGNWNDKRLLKERELDLKERNYAFEQKVVEFTEGWRTLPNSEQEFFGLVC